MASFPTAPQPCSSPPRFFGLEMDSHPAHHRGEEGDMQTEQEPIFLLPSTVYTSPTDHISHQGHHGQDIKRTGQESPFLLSSAVYTSPTGHGGQDIKQPEQESPFLLSSAVYTPSNSHASKDVSKGGQDNQKIEQEPLNLLPSTAYTPNMKSHRNVSESTIVHTPQAVSAGSQNSFFSTVLSDDDDDMDVDMDIEAEMGTPANVFGMIQASPATEYSFAGNTNPFNSPTKCPARVPQPLTPATPAHIVRSGMNPTPNFSMLNPNLYAFNQPAPRIDGQSTAGPVVNKRPESDGFVMVGNVPFASTEIRAMMETLLQAQENNEFPRCPASSLNDASVVVGDYRLLNELRRARGNPANPNVPEKYTQLRIKIEDTVGRRNDQVDVEAGKAEAARRIQAYLRIAEHENECYQAATGAIQRSGGVEQGRMDLDEVVETMAEVVEHGIEHGMAEAAAPIRLNVGRMEKHIGRVEEIGNAVGHGVYAMGRQVSIMNHQMDHQMYQFNSTGQAMNYQVDRFEDHNHTMDHHIHTMDHQMHQFSHAMDYQVNRLEDHFNNTNHAVGHQYKSMNAQSRAMDAQMHALTTMIQTQAATQAALNDSLARSNKMLDTITGVTSSRPRQVSDGTFQTSVDAAVEQTMHARLATHPEANKAHDTAQFSPPTREMTAPVGSHQMSRGVQFNAVADHLEFQPKTPRSKSIKRVLGKFLGRKEEGTSVSSW